MLLKFLDVSGGRPERLAATTVEILYRYPPNFDTRPSSRPQLLTGAWAHFCVSLQLFAGDEKPAGVTGGLHLPMQI